MYLAIALQHPLSYSQLRNRSPSATLIPMSYSEKIAALAGATHLRNEIQNDVRDSGFNAGMMDVIIYQ